MFKRVVVTGIGAVSPIGLNKKQFWDHLLAGQQGIVSTSEAWAKKLGCHLLSPIRDFKPEEFWPKKQVRQMDRFSQFALLAAMEALTNANFTRQPSDLGLYMGTSLGGVSSFYDNTVKGHRKGFKRVHPLLLPMMMPNMAAGNIAEHLSIKGSVQTLSTSCCAANDAIGHAYQAIRHGEAVAMLAGASEAPINETIIAGFMNLQALTPSASPSRGLIPFDQERQGFVMGEGSGMLVLEEYDHAKARGAHIYAELAGYGASNDAYHLTAPDPSANGALASLNAALQTAGVSISQVGYINAHGTGTPLNDRLETVAFKKLLGEYFDQVKISSIKASIGHLLGAGGALEAIATILALDHQVLPQTINYKKPDPDCCADNLVKNQPLAAEVEVALSHSLGFGGQNSSLCFKRIDMNG